MGEKKVRLTPGFARQISSMGWLPLCGWCCCLVEHGKPLHLGFTNIDKASMRAPCRYLTVVPHALSGGILSRDGRWNIQSNAQNSSSSLLDPTSAYAWNLFMITDLISWTKTTTSTATDIAAASAAYTTSTSKQQQQQQWPLFAWL